MGNPYNATNIEMEKRDDTVAAADNDFDGKDMDAAVAMEQVTEEMSAANAPVENKKRKKTEPERMVTRMAEYEEETLLFMYDFNVPFDNNASEQNCRMPKLKLKVSGCFRTKDGADVFAGIRSFVSTTIKKGKNLIEGFKATLCGQSSNFLYPESK
jgi:hypothetical protein